MIGENGAGKSTLMKILSGAIRPDSGSMSLGGAPYAPRGPREALARGVAMIYQELALAPHLSVEANVMLGQERVRMGLIDAASTGASSPRPSSSSIIPTSGPRRGWIGSVWEHSSLSKWPGRWFRARKLIVFDEPTSSLSEGDAERLFVIIDRLKKRGLGIIYISHFLEEVRRVAETFTVLQGRPGGRLGSPFGNEYEIDHHA